MIGRNADAYLWWWQASASFTRQQKATMQEIWHSFVSGIWALFLPVIWRVHFIFTFTKQGPLLLFMRCLSPQLFTVK
ncbi:hypothetical protein ACLB1M_28055 [Escherichia coli]